MSEDIWVKFEGRENFSRKTENLGIFVSLFDRLLATQKSFLLQFLKLLEREIIFEYNLGPIF